MSERNLDFDAVIDRRGTKCLKYDFAVQRGRPADVLPLWVADMDFKTSSYIEDALIRQAQNAIYGYTESDDAYFDAVQHWMLTRHGWQVEPAWLQKTPGIVFAIAVAVRACTMPGEAVLIQQPVYYPFSEVILDNGRRLVSRGLVLDEKTGRPLNGTLLDYKLMTMMDTPDIKADFVELDDPVGPFGNKALGEPPAIPGAPAIRNAVLHATGVAFNENPLTPQRLIDGFMRAGLI